MAKFVVGTVHKCVLYGRASIELVPAVMLSTPKPASLDEEVVCSANKMGQCIGQ